MNAPIDDLFRAMYDAGASDLHLSCGMPPLVRKDGSMRPLDQSAAPLTPDAIDLGLDAALPPILDLTLQIGEFGRGERI